MRVPRTPTRRIGGVVATLLLGAGPILTPVAPATAASRTGQEKPVGYVRLAHLSPDTPAVDVYLTAPDTDEPQVFPAVGYGVVSPYLPVPPGRYAVAMRPAGAPADQKPVLTTEVGVRAGKAYTVAGVGRYADLGLRVLADDLSPPPAGQAKVRVVQASVRAPVLDVAAADGPVIAEGVQFATTTGYRSVDPGSWRLRLGGTNGPRTDARVTLTDGAVYSLLVLDAERGGLTTELREDASDAGTVATGGVDAETGGLGLRGPRSGSGPAPETGAAGDHTPSAAPQAEAGDRSGGSAGPAGTYQWVVGGVGAALLVVGVLALRRRQGLSEARRRPSTRDHR
ncbi:DUF4397 domain-containing protein [Micromonospora sp. NPDC000207]|uniref:DUF4397 domain-containing protein n=1 Tax=Micromonospora sp. NPDC000207 TaxID=3154246 RepID=UPI00331CEC01